MCFDPLFSDDLCRQVLVRDCHTCAICGVGAAVVHPIMDGELWVNPQDAGIADNAVSLCLHHQQESLATRISPEALRRASGISAVVLPRHLYAIQPYDRWGNPVLSDGRRSRGELFYTLRAQASLSAAGLLDQFTPWVRYPRTLVLPWSEHCGVGDVMLDSLAPFYGKRVVVTEKMDGENISLYRDFIHSRSVAKSGHPSREWLNALHARIGERLPSDWRLCGEYLYARHTIGYSNLDSYFMAFSAWNHLNECISWDDTTALLAQLEVPSVKVLYDGVFDAGRIRALWREQEVANCEGYVLRLADAIAYRDFQHHVGKFVRTGFEQSNPVGLNARQGGELVLNQLADATATATTHARDPSDSDQPCAKRRKG